MQSYMILKVQRDFTAYVNLFFYKLLTKTSATQTLPSALL